MNRGNKGQSVGIETFNGRVGLLSGVWRETQTLPEEDYMDVAAHLFIMLDGVIYDVMEDPDDGYRSYMDAIYVRDLMPLNIWTPAEPVIGKLCDKDSDRWCTSYHGDYTYRNDRCNILELWSTVTNKCVVEFGTDFVDDYYPSFVDAFHPQNMSFNCNENLFKEEK